MRAIVLDEKVDVVSGRPTPTPGPGEVLVRVLRAGVCETDLQLIKGYMVRHKVLPGITGLAQVNGLRGETRDVAQMEARVRYDLEYVRTWSIFLDLKILAKTALIVLNDARAY